MQTSLRVLSTLALLGTLVTPQITFAQEQPAVPASEVAKKPKVTESTYDMLNLFGDVFERVRDNYVGKLQIKNWLNPL